LLALLVLVGFGLRAAEVGDGLGIHPTLVAVTVVGALAGLFPLLNALLFLQSWKPERHHLRGIYGSLVVLSLLGTWLLWSTPPESLLHLIRGGYIPSFN
jgi:hypothetical protein